MTTAWPLGPDNPLNRARTIATALVDVVRSGTDLAQIRADTAAVVELADRFGDGDWLTAAPSAINHAELMTRRQVAAHFHVTEPAVTAWSTRGLRLAGEQRFLRRAAGGYLPADVEDWERLRNAPDDDLETFCRCGHDEHEHAPRGCTATQPDRCSCTGFRLGARAQRRSTRHQR